MSAFVMDLATLPNGASRVNLEGDAAELDLPTAEWHGRVQATLDVEKNGDRVSVRGRLHGLAGLDCVRCLRHFEFEARPGLEVFAERAGAGRRAHEQQDLERDHYMKFHDGRRLDLADSAREALLLELPIAPRCRDDCKGLCPRCGADLNEGPCGCSRP